MTASTEQERTEFEAWAQSEWECINLLWQDRFGRFADYATQSKWIAWQAARRAPVVPHDMTLVSKGALQMAINALRRDAAEGKVVRGEMADELLAAAPQPPAAEKS